MPPPLNHKRTWWQKLIGAKSDRQVAREVLQEPLIHEARQTMRKADRILAELQAIEGKRNDD